MTFTIAITGRPNAGKSTLFNRLAGKRLALVADAPGLTRDRRRAEGRLAELRFGVIDTAGLEEGGEGLEADMLAQTEIAVREADLILFLIDARSGILPADRVFADWLRRSGKPIIAVANKMEGKAGQSGFHEAFELGLGDPVAVSAEHAEGMSELRDAILSAMEERFPGRIDSLREADESSESEESGESDELGESDETPVRIAIIGRPNVGKSTLANRMIGEDRFLTGEQAGITRDSVSVEWNWKGRAFRVFDTAGLRRKSKVSGSLEKLSVGDALRAIRFCEAAIVVFDSTCPFEKQDLQIADLAIREGRALVIALNKWDLVDDPQGAIREMQEKAERLLPQVKGLRLVPISALRGEGIDEMMQALTESREAWRRRLPTAALNRWLEKAVSRHPPPAPSGRRIRIKYVAQIRSRPPTFAAFCSRPEALPESYSRYLVNELCKAFDLWGTPVRMDLRKASNPYDRKAG